jgi:predicted DNA-binding protein
MAKLQIEKTMILLSEEEIRRVAILAKHGNKDAIYNFVRDVITKRLEEALRKRCG